MLGLFLYYLCMGKWVHRLTNLNVEAKTATCAECGEVRVKISGTGKKGDTLYRCYTAHHSKERLRQSPWLMFREDTCSRCGFIPEHPSQLDVDHIDGDKRNNSPDNLQTLCANCHRLKTYLNNEWLNKAFIRI